VFRQLGRVVFFIKQQFTSEVNPNMVNKTIEIHILPSFDEATMVITTFDLWMSCGEFNTFSLIINYINKKWEPFPLAMGIFLIHVTIGVAIALQLKYLLVWYDLLDKVIT
jgi:hypothetical protein